VVAGNNPDFPTKGVSDSTLTGRQWGLGPRVGLAWSPRKFNDKIVVRAGWGLYYDRGELFTYLSPGFASGVIAGGPFGVNQSPPWVNTQQCSPYGYEVCSDFSAPWGTALGAPPSGNPADLALPNASSISTGIPLFSFGDYNRANKLPYTMNQTLDIQWQPRRDLAIEIGYVGNMGRHAVVPLPFNQAQIASPTNPIRAGTPFEQDYTYGYSIVDAPGSFNPINLPNGQPYQETFEGGNVDLRVPYIGYSSESESYTAAGISAYHALQTHVEKPRLAGGILLHLLACHRRAECDGIVLQRKQSAGSAVRLWLVGLRPQACDELHLYVPAAQVLRGLDAERQIGRRMDHLWFDRDPERPALQHR
jgi:hypothetical protein